MSFLCIIHLISFAVLVQVAVRHYNAFTQIENEVKKLFPNIQFPKVDYDFEVSYSENAGDILPMLGIKKSKSTQIVAKPKNSEFSDYFELKGYHKSTV